MAKRVKGAGGTSANDDKENNSFKWTDDEVELLLKVTRDYRVTKAAENIDWELIQSKYSDFCCCCCIVFEKLRFHPVYTDTEWLRFQIDPLSIAYSNRCVFVYRFHRFRVNRRWKRSDLVAFSNEDVSV